MSWSWPKVKRGRACMGSCPTWESSSPAMPAIHPFRGSLGAVRLPQMTMPKMERTKNSHEPNWRAIFPRRGEKTARQTRPKKVPIPEEVVARPMAYPASPLRARGLPSMQVAALAGVPGMLSRMADRLPP